jgi:hypothetical protein
VKACPCPLSGIYVASIFFYCPRGRAPGPPKTKIKGGPGAEANLALPREATEFTIPVQAHFQLDSCKVKGHHELLNYLCYLTSSVSKFNTLPLLFLFFVADVCVHGSLRLVGGTNPHEGRLELCYYNQWGTICDDSWSSSDARVACRQLGFSATSTCQIIIVSSPLPLHPNLLGLICSTTEP